MDLKTIKRKLEIHKAELTRRFGIRELGVFGSYARGEQKKDSDVDILVEFSTVPGLRFAALELALEDMLGTKVDLVRKKTIRPELRENILRDVVYV